MQIYTIKILNFKLSAFWRLEPHKGHQNALLALHEGLRHKISFV
jgi:hypothetical protein